MVEEIEIIVTTTVKQSLNELQKLIPIIKQYEKQITNLTESFKPQKITTNMSKFTKSVGDAFSSIGAHIKNGIGHIVNYISSLISIKDIYSKLSNSVKTWLSSDNEQAQQLNSSIGNMKSSITEAFSSFGSYNGNGESMLKNLATSFERLLEAINKIVKGESFQNWLKVCSEKFKQISDKLAAINWEPLIQTLTQIGTTIGSVAVDILNMLVSVFSWFIENPEIAEVLITLSVAIGAVVLVMKLVNSEMSIFYAVIMAIIAVIALVVLAIMNWDNIMNFIKQTIQNVINSVVEFFTNLWNQISFIFEGIWDVISTILGFIGNIFATIFDAIWNVVSSVINNIWNIISIIFQAIWNFISSILTSIWNTFSQIFNWIFQLVSTIFTGIYQAIASAINNIWENIKFVLGKIQEIWSNIWTSISNVVKNIWNGIWNCIKNVINSILSGIENMVNGVIKGINFILSGISNVANAIGSLIGLDPINLKLSYISLPRLAKGGVLTSATALIAGEYSGAKSNPEIVSPQNIMYDTMRMALEDSSISNNDSPIYLTVNVGNNKLGQILLNDLRSFKRQTGKNLEALVGG